MESGAREEIAGERQPDLYFHVLNLDEDIITIGEVPDEYAEALVGEKFRIFDMLPKKDPQLVIIESEEIARSLALDGHDPNYTAAIWWEGYASAYKSSKLNMNEWGQVRIPIDNGEIQEGEEDPEIAEA